MNRVLAHTGARYPIVQAPMGWIARTQLASAVSRAGGLGIIETSSGETEACQAEINKMKALNLPFGVNLPIRFLRDDAMLKFVCNSGVKFVTTSAGSPAKFIAPLKAAGIIGLSRGADRGGRTEMRRGRRRRAGGGGRRGRRLQESRGSLDAGAVAGHPRAQPACR